MKLFLAVICYVALRLVILIPDLTRLLDNHYIDAIYILIHSFVYCISLYLVISYATEKENIPAQINSLKFDLNKLTKMVYVVYQDSQKKKTANNATPKLPSQNINGK